MNQDNKNNNDSGAKFHEEWQRSTQIFYPETPKIIQWVIKYSGGYIKDEKQANYVLLGFVAVAIVVALFLIFGGSESQAPKVPSSPFESP